MKKNMMQRNLHQSIKNSLARYIAIVAIIALGAGMFVGLRSTKSDMVATGQRYMDEQNMFDLRLISTFGWSDEDLQSVSTMEGVVDAEGAISVDLIASVEGAESESVYKVFSIPETVNQIFLHGGRMPQAPDECLADGFHATDDILGKKITISSVNDADTMDGLKYHTYTVVGYVSTPLYMDLSRGNTTLGNGTVSALLYLPRESFDMDYYTELYITLGGESTVYTDAYHDHVQENADRLEPLLEPVADRRYQTVLQEVTESYEDGLADYRDGVKKLQEGREEADEELAEGLQKLLDGQKEIDENRELLESGLPALEQGQETIDKGRKALSEGKVALAKAKADAFSQLAKASSELMENYRQVNNALAQIDSGIAQIDSGLSQLDSGISQLESGLTTLNTMVSVTDTMLNIANSSLLRAERALETAKNNGADADSLAELEATVADARAEVANYETQLEDMKSQQTEYTQQLAQLQQQRDELAAQKAELETTKAPLQEAKNQIDQGFVELQSSQTQAENEFASAEAQLEASALQLDAAQEELDRSKAEMEKGFVKLADAQAELNAGWDTYYQGKADAEREILEGEEELDKAKAQLLEAEIAIASMDGAQVYALGRNTNIGYLSLESNSDIVEGVSAVFPAFFLLIAALVCITTMTRMVEEERTQIGTLKALGYGNGAIIGKYLAYAGSAAIIGCGLGVVIGSIVFPTILWKVYQILLFMGDYLELKIDWGLCALVVGMYTAVTLLVTWYCCRMSLREVPAELIRPKPPTTGKKILLERLPFWNRFSFLNKVMLRNIFRYRQRLLMMIVGIGGCTALLLTGFGVSDSIRDLAGYQFEEVMIYDMDVRFDHGMTTDEQLTFVHDLGDQVDDVIFFHQSSMELVTEDSVKDITFIASNEDLERFIDFHSGSEKLSMPGAGEALLSAGVAKRLELSVGDTIQVRDADMRTLDLKIGGIFDNNVYNYVIVSADTVGLQWEETPEAQMACIHVNNKADIHEVGAEITSTAGVMNVTINQDVRDSVGNMLQALDLVVVTVVVCASLLAIIVLYNLTNINITERIREIATIKVLGFTDMESAAYVFKENLLLSAIGAVFGLGGGIFLLEFVMSQIQVDMVWMTARLLPSSYIWALVITMLSALVVDFVLYFKLNRINMAEALKSVE